MTEQVGVHQVGNDATVEIIEARDTKLHRHIQAVWPPTVELETSFVAGPLFTFKVANGTMDVRTGMVFDTNGHLIRESFGTSKNVQKYAAQLDGPPTPSARQPGLVMPIESARSENFCRWWLDTMSKGFVTQLCDAAMRPDRILAAAPRSRFQRETLPLLDNVFVLPDGERFVQGDIVSTSGLTYAGGQRIAKAVSGFGAAMGDRLERAAADRLERPERIFISRRNADIRRIVEEDAVFAALEPLGFTRIDLAAQSVVEQYQYFSQARLIVAPHGAGLTNLLWSKPGCSIVEIFAEGGVHGSAFLRMASQMELPYFAFVGKAGPNRDHGQSGNNADIVIDPPVLARFIASSVLARS